MLEGTEDGILDGICEGILEGIEDGMLEGIAEGILDGLDDGMAEGTLDGTDDGAAVARPAAAAIAAAAAKDLIISDCQTSKALTSVCPTYWGVTMFIRTCSHCPGADRACIFRHRQGRVFSADTIILPRR